MSEAGIRSELLSAIAGKYTAAPELFAFAWALIRSRAADRGGAWLRCFLEEITPEDLDIDNVGEFFNLPEAELPGDSTRDLENRVVDGLIRKNVSEDEFYEALYQRLSDSTLMPDAEEQARFLMALWMDLRIPYYRLDEGCVMEDEKFVAMQKEIEPQLKKAKHIVFRRDLQRTQQASLLVELSRSIENQEQLAVFWAIALVTYGIRFYSMLEDEQEDSEGEATYE